MSELLDRIEAALTASVDRFAERFTTCASELCDLVAATAVLTGAGGKRIRPQLFYWGWRAGGGPDSQAAVDLSIALEVLHLFALVHDDVMDGADTRRGAPAAHHLLADVHRARAWRGDSDHFGVSCAILLGDALTVWADQVITSSALPCERAPRFRRAYDDMRLELVAGQYLDIMADCVGSTSMHSALRVARLKSGNYTIAHPLRLGAIAAGAHPSVERGFAEFGTPLGEAFQINDDILGVFGSPAVTGKPVGDDLRQGKRTTLVAAAMDMATPSQAHRLGQLLGDPDLSEEQVEQCRVIMLGSGALAHVRQLLADRTDRALRVLDSMTLDDDVATPLRTLVAVAAGEQLSQAS
jgi:geranylgeranyl diphosphate synthase, type I